MRRSRFIVIRSATGRRNPSARASSALVLVVAMAMTLNARFTPSNGSASSYGVSCSSESEQQLLGSAAGGDEPDARLDEPHVQLGVRLDAIGSGARTPQPPPSVSPNGAATTGNGARRTSCAPSWK